MLYLINHDPETIRAAWRCIGLLSVHVLQLHSLDYICRESFPETKSIFSVFKGR